MNVVAGCDTVARVSTVSASVVRAELVRALEVDLIGPYAPEEELDRAPSRFYLTGFLVPREGRGEEPIVEPEDDTESEDAEGEDEDAGAEDVRPAGEGSRRRSVLPASMGMSVLLPPGDGGEVTVVLRCAEYAPFHAEGVKKTTRPNWKRVSHPAYEVRLSLEPGKLERTNRITELPGISIEATLGMSSSPLPGTRALSVFVVNERAQGERGRKDAQYLFQVSLEVRHDGGFLARPALRRGRHIDDKISSLQYRGVCEYAVGHNVSVEAPVGEPPASVRTTWMPRAEVRRVVTSNELDPADPGLRVERGMKALAGLTTPEAVRTALGALPEAYGRWIERQRAVKIDAKDRDTVNVLLERATEAKQRIAGGIELLERSIEARRAFGLANEAMARQARQRLGIEDPQWHLFQLAFVLLCLPSVHDDQHEHRGWVELIFFPTGGGKTEAYLGVIAFTLVLRRLRGLHEPHGGRGVAVLLRYTLRLLTLDQLERAATLMCALELLRREHPDELGGERLSVGLWVGRSATSNTMAEVKTELGEFRKGSGASPCPLAECPWCKTRLGPSSLTLDDLRKPTAVIVGCESDKCPFCPANHPDGVPVVFVDEQIYRELPAFVVGTVDKFAMLPWRAEAGMLFGQVAAFKGRSMIEHGDAIPRGAVRLPQGLLPPELIVQDELHLISGPLGTLVGLYETAIEQLATRTDKTGKVTRPKILASTATVRRAAEQVRALMGRPDVRAFPPQGPDPGETFFARVDPHGDGRLYLGIAATGRAFRATLARVYQTVMAAAQKHYDPAGGKDQGADAYMTLVGYFNALRELGAMRRVVEDEVPQRTARIDRRGPIGQGAHPFLAARQVGQIVELTSRESTAKVKDAKNRLNEPFINDKRRVDVVLASNMISVGVDIDRLGLMVVAGQPTTSAEYIQATSRVGRRADRPGLVISCYNMRRVRDRSFYERFASYHASFYGWVEATSVTPFSEPALDRALAAVLFAMIRHGHPDLAPPRGAMRVSEHPEVVARAIAALTERAGRQGGDAAGVASVVEARAKDLADAWNSQVAKAREENLVRGYSKFDADKKGLARPMLLAPMDPAVSQVDAKFAAPTSMRDTEPSVHLWLRFGLGKKQV
jgi:hypothetical protein